MYMPLEVAGTAALVGVAPERPASLNALATLTLPISTLVHLPKK